jgi:hypothetical protein
MSVRPQRAEAPMMRGMMLLLEEDGKEVQILLHSCRIGTDDTRVRTHDLLAKRHSVERRNRRPTKKGERSRTPNENLWCQPATVALHETR